MSEMSHSKFSYDKFHAGYETNKYVYLLIANNQGIIIDKLKCSEECVAFLRSKMKLTKVKA